MVISRPSPPSWHNPSTCLHYCGALSTEHVTQQKKADAMPPAVAISRVQQASGGNRLVDGLAAVRVARTTSSHARPSPADQPACAIRSAWHTLTQMPANRITLCRVRRHQATVGQARHSPAGMLHTCYPPRAGACVQPSLQVQLMTCRGGGQDGLPGDRSSAGLVRPRLGTAWRCRRTRRDPTSPRP